MQHFRTYLARAVRRTVSARAARAQALSALQAWDPADPDALALRAILSGAGEGTPTACERTAEGFRLFESRVLHSLRFYPVETNGARVPTLPSADPRIGKPEPKLARMLFQTRAGRLIGRELDPRNERDTRTGQGFSPNGADKLADALALRGDKAAEEAACAALARAALRLRPRAKPSPVPAASDAPPALTMRQRVLHAPLRARRAAELRALRAQARAWQAAFADPTDDHAHARFALARIGARLAHVRDGGGDMPSPCMRNLDG